MPMNLLDNELVKKYFGSGECPEGNHSCVLVDRCMAYRVLAAMQEPISKGAYAMWFRQVHDDWIDGKWDGTILDEFHPFALRLPDAFQPKAEKICPRCHKPENQFGHTVIEKTEYGETACIHKPGRMIPCDEPMNHPKGCEHQKPDPVEEKIVKLVNIGWDRGLEFELRELVALARGSK